MTVTLALVGDAARPFTPIDEAEWNRPWADRRRVELQVDENESLARVLERALNAFNVPSRDGAHAYRHVDVAFYEELQPQNLSRALPMPTLVDDQGKAVWGVRDLRLVRYGDVVRAAKAGALAGDPSRVHVILREPVGNGLGVDWPAFLEALDIVWEVAKAVGVVGGVIATAKMVIDPVRNRVKRGRAVAAENAYRWDQRNASPYTFFLWLGERPWSSARLASLLDCSSAEAEAVLELFGFARGGDGRWHPAADDAAALLRDVIDDLLAYYSEGGRIEFERRIEHLLQTGERAPEPNYELEHEWPSMEVIERRARMRTGIAAVGIATISFLAGLAFRRGGRS
jgi:hypothetical protein